jgi:hypothetical protein
LQVRSSVSNTNAEALGMTHPDARSTVASMSATFAYRATDKKHLRLVADPIGPDNDKHLVAMANASEIVVFAYGQPGQAPGLPDLLYRLAC